MDDYGKSSIGFEEGVVAAASYFCISGLILLIIERRSNFVRFHAVQSCLGFALLAIYWLAIRWVNGLWFLAWSPGLLAFIFAAHMMLKAYHGEEYKFPLIGSLAFSAIYDTSKSDDQPSTAGK